MESTKGRAYKTLFAKLFYRTLFFPFHKEKKRALFNLREVRNILVVRDDHIGDLICSTPAFRAIKETCPFAKLTVLASTYNAPVIMRNPFIDRVILYEKHKHSSNNLRIRTAYNQYKLLQSLKRYGFDLAIGLRSHFNRRQAQTVFASGAPFRLGHYPDRPRYQHLSFFYNIYVPESRARKHEVERTLDVIRAIGIEPRDKSLLVVLDDKDRTLVKQQLLEQGLRQYPLIGYHISNRKRRKRWSLGNFAKLIYLLSKEFPEFKHVITFDPTDEKRAHMLSALSKTDTHIVRTPQITFLGALQEQCRIFITLDGAPMHLAVALRVPTLAIFGGSDPTVWHPWSKDHRWIKRGEDINKITSEEVFSVAAQMLKQDFRRRKG